eukprot:TRINITY_DN25988_c0_g1_i1.p2 TRINITY_DN25988_c0_g1~~TRINITY_DN25988_c0_g1_i1.p2  ORF type:complete len:297 (+),score=64.58 TRINITY_DN25988_c0_g1_i1:94-984(+)
MARLFVAPLLMASLGAAQPMTFQYLPGFAGDGRGGRAGEPVLQVGGPVSLGLFGKPLHPQKVHIDDGEALRERCDYLATAKQSPRWPLMSRMQSMKKLEKLCGSEIQDRATAAKERLETRCAWLKELLRKNQKGFLEEQPWFHSLEDMCAMVPEEELVDNAAGVDEQTCVWLMLLRIFEKKTAFNGGPELEAKQRQCPVSAKRKAAALAQKMKPFIQKAESLAKMLDLPGLAHMVGAKAPMPAPMPFHGHGHYPVMQSAPMPAPRPAFHGHYPVMQTAAGFPQFAGPAGGPGMVLV